MNWLDSLSTEELLNLLFLVDPIAALDLMAQHKSGVATMTPADADYLKEMGVTL